MESSFNFLESKYAELYTLSRLAEKLLPIDASSSLAKSRLVAEKVVQFIASFENLELQEEKQVIRINSLYGAGLIPEIIKDVLHTIRKSGNRATHIGDSSPEEARFVLRKTFSVLKWFYETYENVELGELTYAIPENDDNSIEELNKRLSVLTQEIVSYKEKIAELNASEDVKARRKRRSNDVASRIELNEHDTRVMLIDPLLRNAGWECDTDELNFKCKGTTPQKGRNMAIAGWKCGNLWADYALFIGTTLYGIVEAKKFATDISTDLHQSKVYSSKLTTDCDITLLGDWDGYKAPFLFSTNGRDYLEQIKTKSGVWFLDVRNSRNHPKALSAWYSPEGLVELYKKDVAAINNKLRESDSNYLTDKSGLGLREYQLNAISVIENKIISSDKDRRALLVMATGTGKTRTAIGLAYRLVKSNRFRRILFLTDRRLLANQAHNDFKDKKVEDLNTFAEIYRIDGLDKAIPDSETRLHFATVQSMVSRLFYSDECGLAIDAYDCIIVDEAHRGYNLDKELDDEDLQFRNQNDYVSQYKRVIEYFDSYVIGLTATPALHTTQIFGEPTHTYSYREAVIDGYLVDHEPPYLIKTKLSEEGILWEQGDKPKAYNPETNSIEELAALEDELLIEVEQFNKKVLTPDFNRTVIRQLVKEIDPEGDGKTLIFAARDEHADTIVEMLRQEYEAIGLDVHHDAIKKITGKAYKPEEQTKLFKNEKYPNIVVTVDLLSTGVDVPEITNIVFMRRTNSRIYFEQMLGRATRLCPEIGKEFFRIFDAVRVYEALEGFTQMQTVSNPAYSFAHLVREFEQIQTEERKAKQIDQIVAKLRRRCNKIEGDRLDQFVRLSGGDTPKQFMDKLKELPSSEITKELNKLNELWEFLDKRVYSPQIQLVSEHPDELIGVDRGFGSATKPEDYIESFKKYIEENKDSIGTLKTVCTKPSELTRESLKDLKLRLDQAGYSETNLNTAWKTAKNVDIAADVIAYVRAIALGTNVIPPEQRVKHAIQIVKDMHEWTATQMKWINRFEKQLLAETVLTKEDLDKPPFSDEGGYARLNKIFNYELDKILETINENLYNVA